MSYSLGHFTKVEYRSNLGGLSGPPTQLSMVRDESGRSISGEGSKGNVKVVGHVIDLIIKIDSKSIVKNPKKTYNL